VNKDSKAIAESYNAGINNTTRGTDSYAYPYKDYSAVRSEGEESALKKNIAHELNAMTSRAARGSKEDYLYILSKMKKLHEDIAAAINGN